MNQGLETIGSATNFQHYIDYTYIPLEMPLLAKSSQNRYQGVAQVHVIVDRDTGLPRFAFVEMTNDAEA
jgi:hypothetical protein